MNLPKLIYVLITNEGEIFENKYGQWCYIKKSSAMKAFWQYKRSCQETGLSLNIMAVSLSAGKYVKSLG